MKTLKISLLLLTFFLAACKKEKLTKETQIGANTFSCLINGKLFVPKQALFSGEPLYGIYNPTNKTLRIGASSSSADNTDVQIDINDYNGVGVYPLSSNNSVGYNVNIIYRIGSPTTKYYYTALTGQGNVTITRSDSNILSGTFEFVAQNVDNANDKVTCTKGRFDLEVNGIK